VTKTIAAVEGSKIPETSFLWRLLFNPNRSERKYLDFLKESCSLAELRQLEAGGELNQQFARQIDLLESAGFVGGLSGGGEAGALDA